MYFDDFHPGLSITTPQRILTVPDLDAFLELSGLQLPMFLNDESARERGHARRLVTGPMILAVAMGLVRASGWFDQVIAAIGFDEIRFRKAVHPGDSLMADITVLGTRPTRDPERGLVILSFEISNQDGSIVMLMKGTYLFRKMHTGDTA